MISYAFSGRIMRIGNQDCNEPVEFQLDFDAAHDPLAVDLQILADNEQDIVTWTFARDLLVQAANSPYPVGQGDVRFRLNQMSGELYLCLKNPIAETHADFSLPVDQVREFLADTVEEAAQPQAYLDTAVDELIAEILG